MEFEAFQSVVEQVKARQPLLFELERDRIPEEGEIQAFEQQCGIRLPEKYIQFLRHYGGGYFGFANLYSLDETSYFYLLAHNQAGEKEFLCVADNECGDEYGLKIEQGQCQDAVIFYDHEEKTFCDTGFSDILEYLAAEGLKWPKT